MLFALLILPSSYAIENEKFVGGYFHPGGMYGGYSGYHFWLNYNPFQNSYGTLTVNPKGTYEGEITATDDDADFDGCTGYDKHGYGARARLIPYYPTQTELAECYGSYEDIPKTLQVRGEWPHNTTGNETPPMELSPLEKAQYCFLNNQIIRV